MSLASYPLCSTDQQEEFSRAYIHAIASASGYGVEYHRIDRDSVDVVIKQYPSPDGTSRPIFEELKVQAKCTYAFVPSDNVLKFPLPIKNYNDLRPPLMTPRILVVVHVPRPPSPWLIHEDVNMLLHHNAYWMSLKGYPSTTNTTSVTIDIPLAQRFTIDALTDIMNQIGQGNKL